MEILFALALALLAFLTAASVSSYAPTATRHQHGRSVAEIKARLAAEAGPAFGHAGRRC
ncbi:hypothetical protein [Nocardia huaxiensis]|uniref:hypothetical protein n=1 Tax=Nocardia huaxiensis TaxID=2755382 RepID=UPI001E4D43DE|nr:hypothetical protein [Nocardia huaxiensis]UFS94135.1 hypothetical protein LPY97_25610 [Nocardia huaxiensis]